MQTDFPYEEGDTFSIASWGRLSRRDLAQHGIEALAGMIRAHHGDCPSPIHFWCAPPDMQVFALAELYQAKGDQGELYIGCYLRGADFDSSGIPSIHERPSLKAVMQRMDDGRVLVNLGKLAAGESGESVGGLGLLDQRTSELIVVTPGPLADVPMGEDNQALFCAQKAGQCLEPGPHPAGSRVFSQYPSARVCFVPGSPWTEPPDNAADQGLPIRTELNDWSRSYVPAEWRLRKLRCSWNRS